MSQTANIAGYIDVFFSFYQTDIEINETECDRKTKTHTRIEIINGIRIVLNTHRLCMQQIKLKIQTKNMNKYKVELFGLVIFTCCAH